VAQRLRIGLTGGIGSGKSSVAGRLVACGATIVDTDAIARALTGPGGAGIEPIRREFGADFIDPHGALDRDRMRARAFGDVSARRRLESILHPLIGLDAERQFAASAAPVVVFDVPLLVESGRWRDRVDRVLVIDCDEATQIARVMQRSGWSLDAVVAVIAQQATRVARRAAADAVIYNDGITLEQLDAEVGALWRLWNVP
jgi:dephospho-CoA kinase